MQQITCDSQGEALGLEILYGAAQPHSAGPGVLRERRTGDELYRQRDGRSVQWMSPNHTLDGVEAPGTHQQRERGKGPMKVKKADIWQFLRFCIVGTSNAVIDFLVLNVLLWVFPTADTWRVLSYNSLAVLLAATNSFFWNKRWTFQQRHPLTFQELYRFIVVASGTTLMNDTLMWLLGRAFPNSMNSSLVGTNALKFGAILGTMSISFFGMRLWVFFQKRNAGVARSLAEDTTKRLPAIKLVSDVETPITFMDRRLGTSKMSRKILIEAFTWVVRTRLRKQPATHAPTRQQSNDQAPDTTTQNAQEEELLSVASTSIPLGQVSLSPIRPVKLVPLQ